MKNRTSIELSTSAFSYNIEHIKKAANGAAVGVVIKSNAYGHGMLKIAEMAQADTNVAWLCTAGIAEALQVRAHGITKPILALSYLDDNLEFAIQYTIHMGVYNFEDLVALNTAALRVGKKAFVHIKIDTGMSRLGVLPENALAFIRATKELSHIELYGIFTHLCDTPNPNKSFSRLQLEKFDEVLEILESAGIHIPCIHAQSSSALSLTTSRRYDLVRAGAASYGIWKSESHKALIRELHPHFDLKPVIQWKTNIIQIKHIPVGASVGYDRTWIAQRPSTVAIAPIGYWDGYSRGLSNRGIAVINGNYAPVVGIVSMNMTAFDVTDIDQVKLYDTIMLLADIPQIRAHECAAAANIITNELVTHINSSIERMIVSEHAPLSIQTAPHESLVTKIASTPPL